MCLQNKGRQRRPKKSTPAKSIDVAKATDVVAEPLITQVRALHSPVLRYQ